MLSYINNKFWVPKQRYKINLISVPASDVSFLCSIQSVSRTAATLRTSGKWEQCGWKWLISERLEYAETERLVRQLTIRHIRAKRSMKANTTDYASTRTTEENQQLHLLAHLLPHTRHYAKQQRERNTLLLLQINKSSSCFMLVRKPVLCANPQALPSCNMSILLAGEVVGRDFAVSIQPLWWKWRNATGYRDIRGSQEHPVIVPVHAPLQIDFLQQAHVFATRPQMPPWTGQWNQLTALTCSLTRSQLSICRDDMVQTAPEARRWTQ